jgi:hypothetical protein
VKEAQIVKDRVSGRSKGLVFQFSQSVERALANCPVVLVTWSSRTKNPFRLRFSLPDRSS